jgi:hypothetical protein
VIDAGYFTTIAGLGVSIAGFAAIMHSFRGGEIGRLTGWRIRYIVTGGFSLSAASVGVVALGIVVEDPDLQVRLATLLGTLTALPSLWTYRSLKDPEIFRTRGERVSWVIGSIVAEGMLISNLVLASYGYLVVLWALMLASAMSIFIGEVSSLYRAPDPR